MCDKNCETENDERTSREQLGKDGGLSE